MTSMKLIEEFLALKRIAIVGVSQTPSDFSRKLFREFLARGYDAVPVNPHAMMIDGHRCFARLLDIEPPVEAALVMTSQLVTHAIVRDCADAGIRRVWLYGGAGGHGASSPAAIEFSESNGLATISGECPLMFLPGAGWIHRIHGTIMKMTGAYPH
jgi:predicted CoA-binding protein